MDCEQMPISCQLSRIAEQLETLDWNAVLAALIGSVPAAAIAAWIAIMVFRGERKERYESRLVDAVENLSKLLARYANDYRSWLADGRKHDDDVANGAAFRHAGPAEPDRADLDVSLDLLLARTTGKDRTTAEQFKNLIYELFYIQDGDWLRNEYATVRRVMAAWCARRKTDAEVQADITTLNKRRELVEAEPSIAPSKLPTPPEQYKRPAAI